MKLRILAICIASLVAAPALAAGDHDGGHDEALAIGMPGNAAKAKRTITVTMKETDDGAMAFNPAKISIREGETVRLKLKNSGQLEHEFVMDTPDEIIEHKAMMQKFPEMEHDDPNARRLAPGGKDEIIWTFAKAGDFGFACLIPGHYELGMKGDIKVTNRATAKNAKKGTKNEID